MYQGALNYITPGLRVTFYLIVVLFAVVAGSLDAYYGENDPEWVQGLVRVAQFLTVALGLTAATHVPAAPDAQARHAEENADG